MIALLVSASPIDLSIPPIAISPHAQLCLSIWLSTVIGRLGLLYKLTRS